MLGKVPLARRIILHSKRQFLISVIGAGLALGLILFLEGLWIGFQTQISAYEDHVGADLFVAAQGTTNLLGETSTVTMDQLPAVRAVPEVNRADPILARWTVLEMHDKKQFSFMVGYPLEGMGGPWALEEGRGARSDDEIVVDVTLARQHNVEVGEQLTVMGNAFRVVGLSKNTRSWMASLIFISLPAAQDLLRAPDSASHFLVRAGDDSRAARDIEQATGLTALPSHTIAANDKRLLSGIMAGPINLMVAIAFAAGTLILALTVYSAIEEHIREYGIVKEMGASRTGLFRIVLGQTSLLATSGMAAGGLFFVAGAELTNWLRPHFWVSSSPTAIAGVMTAAAGMALLAALVPFRRVSRLDPASLYRSAA